MESKALEDALFRDWRTNRPLHLCYIAMFASPLVLQLDPFASQLVLEPQRNIFTKLIPKDIFYHIHFSASPFSWSLHCTLTIANP